MKHHRIALAANHNLPRKIFLVALALAVCSGAAVAAEKKNSASKKGQSFEECQKRRQALGAGGSGHKAKGGNFNPTSPNAQGYIARCMRGEI